MPTKSLFDNFVGPWGVSGSYGAVWSDGNNFQCASDGEISQVKWYRPATGTTYAITHLSIWDRLTGTLVWSTNAPVDTGTVGWHATTVSPPVGIFGNRTYTVAMHGVSGKQRATLGSGFPAAPYPLLFANPFFAQTLGGTSPTYPGSTNLNNSNMVPVDVVWESTVTTGEPDVTEQIDNGLEAWLSSDVNDYPTRSTPYMSWELLTDPSEGLAAIKALSDTLISAVEAALGPGGDFTVGAVRAVLEPWHDILADALDNTPPTIMGPGNPTIADVMNAIAALPTSGACHFPMPLSATGWAAGTPASHTGAEAIATPADAYLIEVTDVGGETRTSREVGTETVYWLRAWAKPWDGTNVYPINIDIVGPAFVVQSGQRWPGVMVWFPPGVQWDITPYDYTP